VETEGSFITLFTTARRWSLSWTRWKHSTPFYHSNIILPSTFRSFKPFFSVRLFDQNFVRLTLLFHAFYMLNPSPRP